MLDQLIYTRCNPSILIEKNGMINRSDGYGVFAISDEIYTNGKVQDLGFLRRHTGLVNASKEKGQNEKGPGLFSSYEYHQTGPEAYSLSFEYVRGMATRARESGAGHRKRISVKQCLIGKVEDYPVNWFGADVWTAHMKDENYYYKDNDPNYTSPSLPRVNPKPAGGYMNIRKVKEFVNDGRSRAVKKAIRFLNTEMAKPEGQRKVLLIKDYPENVEKWVAAITYGFSVPMARKITFTTNRRNLGYQADSALFCYKDSNGRIYDMMNAGVNLTRSPYCMIVGYHPLDRLSANTRQMQMSNFVILDGETKKIGFESDDKITGAYYSAVVKYDDDIQDFCNIVLPGIPVENPGCDIAALYDAYKYILDSDHKSDKWEYKAAMEHLGNLLQYGMLKNQYLINYIVDECIKIYPEFALDDESKGYPLLKIMWRLAKTTGRQREITGCGADIIGEKLENLTAKTGGITATWNIMKTTGAAEIVLPALKDILNDTELPGYSKEIKNCTAQTAHTLLDMFFFMLSKEDCGIAGIDDSGAKKDFVCLAVIALMPDYTKLESVMKNLSSTHKVFNTISLAVAEYLDRGAPDTVADWWDIVINIGGGNIIEVCKNLCASKAANMDMVEGLLANRLKNTGRYDKELSLAFDMAVKTLGRNKDTGKALFTSWIKVSQPGEFMNIIREIEDFEVSAAVEEKLFTLMDNSIPYDITRQANPALFRELKQWGDALKLTSVSAGLYELKRITSKEKTPENFAAALQNFGKNKVIVKREFLNSALFGEIANSAADMADSRVHLAVVCMFRGIENTSVEEYAGVYVSKVLSETKNRNLTRQLLALCSAAECDFSAAGKTAVFVEKVQEAIEKALENQLIKYYKPSLAEQVSKYEACDPQVRKKLIAMLKTTGEKAEPKGIGGIFGNWFRK